MNNTICFDILKNDTIKAIINYVISYGKKQNVQIFVSTINTDGVELKADNHHILKGKAIDLFEEDWLV